MPQKHGIQALGCRQARHACLLHTILQSSHARFRPMPPEVPGMTGMMEESATRKPRMPNTRSKESTTAPLPLCAAILAVPVSALPAGYGPAVEILDGQCH